MMKSFVAGAMMLACGSAMAGETVTYAAGDVAMEGYYAAAPDAAGTVVILPTWKGVSDYEKDRADMLAEAGWNAFVGDLHGAGRLPKSTEEMAAAHDAFFADEARELGILRAAVEAADRLGGGDLVVMGYSMGGGATMDIVRSGLGSELGVDGYAVFSGRVSDPKGRMVPEGSGPIFVAHGEKDGRVPVSGLVNFEDDMSFTDVPVEIHIYEGKGHLFSAFGFPNYDAAADAESWAAFTDFLGRIGQPEGLDG